LMFLRRVSVCQQHLVDQQNTPSIFPR